MPDTLLATTSSLLTRERGLVWHPYSALRAQTLYAVRAAEGVRLRLADAEGAEHEVIDAMSSWWSTIHGYRHPVLDDAVREQTERFSHVMFGGLTHEPAVELAERLVAMTPESMRHVFFADSGSVSVEVALKLAVQVQAAQDRPERRRFIALRGGYHGDTAGAMSVCDPVDGMHAAFAGHVAEQVFLPRPPAARLVGGELRALDEVAVAQWCVEAERAIADHAHEVAGVIVEPILQGAGGMHIWAPDCLRHLRELTTAHGILLIHDEIATGFGRTGRMWAGEWAGVEPDILCVGKALTGGYLTLAAMLCSSAVADALEGSDTAALLHGPTFMANPLACAVASASLDLVRTHALDQVHQVGAALSSALASPSHVTSGLPRSVRDLRTLGAVGVIELDPPVDVTAVTRAAVRRGVWVRPFRNLVYTMPPYTSTPEDVAMIGAALLDAVAEVHG
ncbi:adenosylmethionine--8-amino-7-oxononanoate transaminase [Knoellia subterranea]|uniref:Adenosylmethionine-8-amino-7-oxononanoate aminotransferase n=1 Tax=Knoellia subterranea KCTC 19937 TaxID=1385521 RepID=A0A0A0JPM6_9MICO|nr:adenosylmethionine--8-amino-7-oxononanoate transaminase [Knoellia subterranea]KGN37526.1 adenosylmethionine-8-amino-7-oxononanoate aminotransferase [Knoellia subterranea KCTC 19937]